MRSKKCPLVMVEWVDSAQPQPAWRHLADIGSAEAIKCVSVGWLISDDRKNKRLAPNMGAVNDPGFLQVSGVITIPTRCVTRVTRLKEPRLAG